MGRSTLKQQGDWCIEAKKYISGIDQELGKLALQNYNLLQNLAASGYYEEGLKPLREKYNDFAEKINKLRMHLRIEHFDYVDEQHKEVIEAIENLENT